MAKLHKKASSIAAAKNLVLAPNGNANDESLLFDACISSIAYALAMQKNGQLTEEEFALIQQSLAEIAFLAEHQCFVIHKDHQSIYDAIEHYLNEKLGDLSHKLKLSQSRYNQGVLDIRLYLRKAILDIRDSIYYLGKSLLVFSERFQHIPIQHHQHNEESSNHTSIGLWGNSLLDALLDDLELLKQSYEFISLSPLDSTTQIKPNNTQNQMQNSLLGLLHINHSILYTSLSKGKFEAATLFAFVQVMDDLYKLAADLLFFNCPPCSYISFSPQNKSHKNNSAEIITSLDVVRAKAAMVKSLLFQILDARKNGSPEYPSLYHQVLQPSILAAKTTIASLEICRNVLSEIKVNENGKTNSKTEATKKKLSLPPIENTTWNSSLKRLEANQLWSQKQRDQWDGHCNRLLGR